MSMIMTAAIGERTGMQIDALGQRGRREKKVACGRWKSMLRSWHNGEVGPGCGEVRGLGQSSQELVTTIHAD